MILLLLYWTLLLPLFLGWGLWGHYFISTHFRQQSSPENLFVLIFIGVGIVGLLASLCSFVVPLGQDPYLLLVLYVVAIAAIYSKRLVVANAINKIYVFNVTGVVFVVALIIVVCKSASPSEILDEKGYYLPYIKWIETYGITPGLANLQGRFGFNSSWHILSALLSLRWSGMLFYDLNGFVILVVLGYYLLSIRKVDSPVQYVCGLFVSAFIFRNFLTSSAADLPNIYLASLVLIWMIGKYEKNTLAEIDYTFIVSFFISFYLVTIKPSSIYLLLIYLPTFVTILYDKQFNKIAWLICIGLLFIIPWCVRFYITTGYLVFPVVGIDLFNPDWKVPYQSVIAERNAVRCFPISDSLPVSDVLKMSFLEWFPQWFKKCLIEQKVFFISIIGVTFYYIGTFKKHLHSLNGRLFIAIQAVLLLNIVIWLTQYPDFRFAWGYILIYVFIGIYFIAQEVLFFRNNFQAMILFFLISMTCMHLIRTCKDVSGNYQSILFQQARFKDGEIEIKKIHTVSYYKSTTAWDIPLPSILDWQNPYIELRDSTLKAGFRPMWSKKMNK